MKLTDSPGWPPWLEVTSEKKGSVLHLRVKLSTWRQRLGFAVWVACDPQLLRWWERPLFVLWFVLFRSSP